MRASRWLPIACVALCAHAASAGAPGTAVLRKLFPRVADIRGDAAGLVRLPLPPEVLTSCRPDLSDLRIVDQDDEEVPYLIDSGLDADARVALERSADATIVLVRHDNLGSAAAPVQRETYEIAPPVTLPREEQWSLVLRTRQPRFVRQVEVSAVADDGRVTPIAVGESLFRLPNAGEHLALPLPSSTTGRLRIALTGDDGVSLDPTFQFVSTRPLPARETLALTLVQVAYRTERGASELEVARPRGVVPDVVRITTTTPLFDRRVQVYDEGAGSGGALLGEARLVRLAGTPAIEHTEIAVRPALGDRLRLRFDDGDSPPLHAISVAVVVRRPALVFALPATDGAPAATLLFGGGRVQLPRYDVSALLPRTARVLEGEQALAAARLYDPTQIHAATLGESSANADFEDAAVLAFAMRPGTAVDPRLYTHRRSLTVIPSHDGLTRFDLEAADAAVARPDLADLRVVDAHRAQWPYLLARDHERRTVTVTVHPPTIGRGESRYHLDPPALPLSLTGLTLDTDAPFLDRAYRVIAVLDGDPRHEERVVASGRLSRRSPDTHPLTIALDGTRVRSLDLIVDDGDETPLQFRLVSAEMPVTAVFFAAPGGDYTLLLGNADDQAPRYELAAIRDLVLALASAHITPAPLASNPEYRVQARLGRGGTAQTVLLWAVLAAAVVVLGGVTLRLARTETPPMSDGEPR
ncbi:MAG TPA: DUF3999 family protein [Candidatus Binatia bacterium]|jgi:hypothetical protein